MTKNKPAATGPMCTQQVSYPPISPTLPLMPAVGAAGSGTVKPPRQLKGMTALGKVKATIMRDRSLRKQREAQKSKLP